MSALRPDLVIFDIDGTLLATDSFWLDIGERAVRTVYGRHGIADAAPAPARFLEAMGLPMRAFWELVLPADRHGLIDEIESESQELEGAAFASGRGAMYPGARDLLVELHGLGIQLALASNCGRRYLDWFVGSFHLDELLVCARSADSPGVRSKGDMVREILDITAAGRPVFVGDRDGDRRAAREHGVPFILFTGGFQPSDAADGDGVAHDFAELRTRLLG